MVAAKKTQTVVVAQSAQQVAECEKFPHPVEPPFRAGWGHALTEKYGKRGKAWTSTENEPQWTVRFKDSNAAVWFEKTWTAQ